MATSLSSVQLRQQLAPAIIPASDPRASYRNWARSYASTPLMAFQPTTEEQCAAILRLAALEGRVVRAVGSGHSPSDLPCTSDFMIRMDKMNKLIELDREKLFVVIQAGMTIQTVHGILAPEGLAMSNVGSISDTSIAGVISTGTHGSGIDYGCLATHVLALDIMLADGSRVHCSRSQNSDLFLASLCGLGATGLILNVTLEVEHAFRLKEIRRVMHIDDVIRDIEQLAVAGEYVRMWWSPQTEQVSVMTADRTFEPSQNPSSWFWGSLVAGMLGELIIFLGMWIPILAWYGNVLKSRIGIVPGTFVGRSDKILNVDCEYFHYTTEWNIPYTETQTTLAELRAWIKLMRTNKDALTSVSGGPSFPLEIRFSKGDDIFLSPAHGRTSCWIGITKYKPYAYPVPFQELSRQFEDIMKSHQGRPHWAKSHSFTPSGLRSLYPHFDDYLKVVNAVDPKGRFQNEYIRRHLFVETSPSVYSSRYAQSV